MAVSKQQQLPSFVPSWATGMIQEASQRYNIPAPVLASLIQQESGFQTHVTSPAGAQGIAQFMPETAKGYGINPFNPAQAIAGAAHYLRNSMDAFGGSIPLALAAYNSGQGNVHKYGGIPPFPETQNYVRNIIAMSGISGATPKGQGPQQQSPQRQQMPQQQGGAGPIPSTQINNPHGAAPQPLMGRAGSSGQMQGQMGQAPSPYGQGMSNMMSQMPQQQPRMMGNAVPMIGSGGQSQQSRGGKPQQQQAAPVSAADIIAQGNASSPTPAAQAPNSVPMPASNILQYLLGQAGGGS
jgi:hypothetical protein